MNSLVCLAVSPGKGGGMLVVALNIRIDAADEVAHGSKGASPDALRSDHAEPNLHLIEPGAVGGRVMQMDCRMGSKPVLHSFGLMS
jgi:hypothetical protein